MPLERARALPTAPLYAGETTSLVHSRRPRACGADRHAAGSLVSMRRPAASRRRSSLRIRSDDAPFALVRRDPRSARRSFDERHLDWLQQVGVRASGRDGAGAGRSDRERGLTCRADRRGNRSRACTRSRGAERRCGQGAADGSLIDRSEEGGARDVRRAGLQPGHEEGQMRRSHTHVVTNATRCPLRAMPAGPRSRGT